MESYVGSVFAFGFNFAPVGWLPCDGRLVSISENEVLFTLLGTTFGGDGQTTFGLPDLRSRVPIGTGQGPGLANYVLGQKAGSESVTLTLNNLAAHTHPLTSAQILVGRGTDATDPTGKYFGVSGIGNYYDTTSIAADAMAADTGNSTAAGGSVPIEIINPYQAVNYCIAMVGIYPSQS